MNSIQFNITANDEEQEILISQLSDMGAEGFEQKNEQLVAYFNELTLKSYDVNNLLKKYQFQTNTIKEQNWNSVWESNFEPISVGDFCSIRAEFHKQVPAEHEIIITPKLSFGTGHHATTFLMIERMKEMEFTGKSVFDFGTGTGILAILAEKLGSASIIAIDTDHWSKENAEENIARNNCKRIEVNQTSIIPDKRFDIILANINRNVLLEYMPQLKLQLNPGGSILMSGLLLSDENDIVEACAQQQFIMLQRNERNKWISMLWKAV